MRNQKILFAATVVKTHVMQFHLPCLQMLRGLGWETWVAAKNDYENPDDCRIPGCDHYIDLPFERLPWKKANLTAYRRLKALIEKEQFSIVHCHTPVGAMVARLAARKARKQGTKVVYTAHGFHFFTGAPIINWLLYYPAEKLLAPLTDVLITINQEDYVRALKKLKARKILYIPGVGIDTRKFYPDEALRAQKRRELGLQQEDFVLLTVAEMTRNKNHATVLRAIVALKGKPVYDHIRYLICGRGEQWENLKTLAETLGIQDRVSFLGYRSDAAELYRAGDLFCFMSYREGLSVALMEALCSGMCAVCTEIRGNTDLIQDGVTGVYCENDPAALAERISMLYEVPELRQRLGRQAAEQMGRYDQQAILEEMKKVYEDLQKT